ncbi:MAG: hypothetical protein HeimC2_29460 [Candidatus Heimdallarchaeota archaeon LC_2]|nr:MAG: hypothetical protein HeimC2_29460 [Candidatus Heimdallarchaeota archaeon LC_2]
MRILYGINTNGQGHINRTALIIDQLVKEGHRVDIVFSGPKPPDYAKKIARNWMSVLGYRLIFRGKVFNMPGTLVENIRRLFYFPNEIKNLVTKVQKYSYDLILTDFDFYTSLTGKILKIPTIAVDHQHSLIHNKAIFPKNKRFDRIAVQLAVHLTVPHRDHYIAIDFADKIYSNSKGTLYPLIHKNDIDAFEVNAEDHYTIYLYSWPPRELINFFTKYHKENFHVFGYNVDLKYKNLIFKPTSRVGFLKDMTSSKGIITQGGFSLIWEAAQIKKPVFAIPQINQFEQYISAYRMSELELGYFAETLNTKDLDKFFEFSDKCNYKTSHKLPILTVQKLTRTIMLIYNKL